jgi:hypothetical protein
VKSYGGERTPGGGTGVLAVAGGLPEATAAIAEGAGLIDLWRAGPRTLAAVRARHPGAAICAPADWAGLVRDPATARRTGAVLICAGPAEAARAAASGIARGRLLVEAPPGEAAGLMAAGWRVVVTTDEEAGPHAAAAVGAIACWLGAAAVRTRHVAAVRRAIDMTEAIKGTRGRGDHAERGREDRGNARPG